MKMKMRRIVEHYRKHDGKICQTCGVENTSIVCYSCKDFSKWEAGVLKEGKPFCLKPCTLLMGDQCIGLLQGGSCGANAAWLLEKLSEQQSLMVEN